MKNRELRTIYPLKSIYKPDIQSNKKKGTYYSTVVHTALHTHNMNGVFSTMYIGLLKQQKAYSEDELELGRQVFRLLYHKTGRDLPGYFPNKPAEELHNPARTRWQNLIDYRKKATLSRRRKEIHIDFDDDMDRTSIKEYRSLLPQDIKHGLEGNLLIIQTPDRFSDWINEGQKKRPWYKFWSK